MNFKKIKNLHLPITWIHRPTIYIRSEINVKIEKELYFSIKKHGLIEPIKVRYVGVEHYELISGYRRLNAFKDLNNRKIPTIIFDVTEEEAEQMMFLESIFGKSIEREDVLFFIIKLILKEFSSLVDKNTREQLLDNGMSITKIIKVYNESQTDIEFEENSLKDLLIRSILTMLEKLELPIQSTINRLKILEGAPIVEAAMWADEISPSTAVELTRVKKKFIQPRTDEFYEDNGIKISPTEKRGEELYIKLINVSIKKKLTKQQVVKKVESYLEELPNHSKVSETTVEKITQYVEENALSKLGTKEKLQVVKKLTTVYDMFKSKHVLWSELPESER